MTTQALRVISNYLFIANVSIIESINETRASDDGKCLTQNDAMNEYQSQLTADCCYKEKINHLKSMIAESILVTALFNNQAMRCSKQQLALQRAWSNSDTAFHTNFAYYARTSQIRYRYVTIDRWFSIERHKTVTFIHNDKFEYL